MQKGGSFREQWLRPFFFYGNNWPSLIGGAITTASAVVLIGFWVVSFFGHGGSSNPYIGIVLFLLLPAVFVAGLVLIAIGILARRSFLRSTGQVPSFFPEVSLRDPVFRRAIDFALAATFINFIIVGTASYRGVAYMDTVAFCGATCHVMKPEFSAYHVSSHSTVACTECHIAPGLGGYIHAKLNGTNQLFMVLTHNYPRPIMAQNKVPAAASTCLHCHNANQFVGDKLLVQKSYADDKLNSQSSSVTVMHVGGRDSFSRSSGIHGAHSGRIEYVSTGTSNQVIPWIRQTDANGAVTEFMSVGVKAPVAGQVRLMDCIDCHNRPAHAFDTPEDALNKKMAQGSPSASLPFAHKEGLALIKAAYESTEIGAARIKSELTTFYRSQYPAVWNAQRPQIDQAARTLAEIYSTNVFPAMKVTWGTHPNNIGHNNSPGCFRCHDGNHSSKSGVTITNDCSACHNLLVSDEQHPKLLTDLGMQ
jgi:hypothetical protein